MPKIRFMKGASASLINKIAAGHLKADSLLTSECGMIISQRLFFTTHNVININGNEKFESYTNVPLSHSICSVFVSELKIRHLLVDLLRQNTLNSVETHNNELCSLQITKHTYAGLLISYRKLTLVLIKVLEINARVN